MDNNLKVGDIIPETGEEVVNVSNWSIPNGHDYKGQKQTTTFTQVFLYTKGKGTRSVIIG